MLKELIAGAIVGELITSSIRFIILLSADDDDASNRMALSLPIPLGIYLGVGNIIGLIRKAHYNKKYCIIQRHMINKDTGEKEKYGSIVMLRTEWELLKQHTEFDGISSKCIYTLSSKKLIRKVSEAYKKWWFSELLTFEDILRLEEYHKELEERGL